MPRPRDICQNSLRDLRDFVVQSKRERRNMTRETKIGLLVGLAFIIVIGILLSDHLTSATEPPQAPLVQAGGNVRTAVMVPGAQTAPPITNVAPQRPVAPQQQVPTKEELTPKQPPVAIVQIGPGNAAPPQHPASPAHTAQTAPHPIAQAPMSQPPIPAQASEPEIDSGSTNPPAHPGAARNSTLARIAHGMGEEIVPAGESGNTTGSKAPNESNGAQTAVAIPPGAKQYKAEPGDSLGKIASRTLGSAGKAACDAIIALNPSLQKNPNLVVAGRTYVIPPNANAPAAGNSSTPAARMPSAPAAPIASDTPPLAAPGVQPIAPEKPAYFYTVKPGDTLTRIAMEQLGSASAVQAIRDLNQDALKGTDLIRANQKLRLPAKPIASAAE
jgi:LysM repeat protein